MAQDVNTANTVVPDSTADLPASGGATAISTARRGQLRPPWQKGQSGNPTGARKRPLTDALAKELTPEVCQAIAKEMVKRMAKASVPHFNEVANRIEGKVTDADGGTGNVVFNIQISAPRPGRQLKDEDE